MANVKITAATLLSDLQSANLPAAIASDATNYRIGTRAIADYVIVGANDAAADLAALNAAGTAVGASETSPATIKIVGTFAMGATRPNQLSYITLDLTQAYMIQTANFTDAAPWLRGTGMNIVGGTFGSNLGAVAADNSILFGDTTTAGDGPIANVTGVTLDATWDTLTAARTLISCADTTNENPSYIQVTSLGARSTANRMTVNFPTNTDYKDVRLLGGWGAVTFSSTNSTFFCEYVGGNATLSGTGTFHKICYVAGTVSVSGGAEANIGTANGAFTASGGNRFFIGACNTSCTFSGTNQYAVINEMSSSGFTASSATNGTFIIMESSNFGTVSVGNRNTLIVNVAGTNTTTFATGIGSDISVRAVGNGADIVIAATLDSCDVDVVMDGGSSSVTVTGGAFNNQINIVSDVTPSFTTTAAQCENIVYWQRFSASVNYPKQLVSYKGPNRVAKFIALADITALGASTSGQLAFFNLPATKRATRAFVLNGGATAATISTLTASMGPAGSATAILTAATVYAANAASDTLGATLTQSYTADTAIIIEFVADANLNTTTGLGSGLIAVMEYI